jgi:type IV secretory pathway TraG/TraD family ATPase VirD4
VAQLEKIYDQKAFSQLRGSCAYTITFTVNDPQTADDFSRAIGNMTVKRKSVSGRHILDESKSISEEGIPLVRPQQLTSLSQGELIILRQGSFQTPVKARCAFYFKEPQLNKIVNKCLNPSRL